MRKLSATCLAALFLDFLGSILLSGVRNSDLGLLGLVTFCLVFGLLVFSVIFGFQSFHRSRFRAFVPALICLIGLPTEFILAGRINRSITMSRFQKNLPRYMEVVRLIEKGELKPEPGRNSCDLPANYEDLARNTLVFTNKDGILIEFWTGGGFPVVHWGYMYAASGSIEKDTNTLQRWPIHSRINANWFRICD